MRVIRSPTATANPIAVIGRWGVILLKVYCGIAREVVV
jgi:hypothetical protein